MPNPTLTASLAAWLFVIIWASGFVVARGISGLIDPYLFLILRSACVLLIFAVAMILTHSVLPNKRERWHLMGIGALMQGLYLGPAFWAVSQGLEAGVMSLLGTIQPPLTAILAWYFYQENISKRTIAGLLIGISGVTLAVAPGLGNGATSGGISGWVVLAAIFSISAITVGTLLQKSSIVTVPLLSSMTFQTLGATLIMLVMALVLGHWKLPLTAHTALYLSYAILVLSIGGFTLLTWLVRTGSATRASSLLLMAPPLAALMSWWLYGETLSMMQIGGFALSLIGVTLARSAACR